MQRMKTLKMKKNKKKATKAAMAEGSTQSNEMKMIQRRTDRIHKRSPAPPLEWKYLPNDLLCCRCAADELLFHTHV